MLLIRIVLLISLSVYAHVSFSSSEDWLKLGRKSVAEQQFDLAIFFYSNELRENPRNIQAYMERSRAYKLQGDLIRSAEDMKKAYELDPAYTKSVKELGNSKSVRDETSSENSHVSSKTNEQ